MSSRDAAELKAEGAIEAAQNSDSRVASDAAQKELVEQSKNAGVAAFSFNPDASPEEKRAQAKAVGTSPALLSGVILSIRLTLPHRRLFPSSCAGSTRRQQS